MTLTPRQNGAEVSRVLLVMLCGLDSSLWQESAELLPTLRASFPPPVSVYGVSPNATICAPFPRSRLRQS